MHVTKMQGLGNDYIYINCLEQVPEDLPGLAARLSDRHFDWTDEIFGLMSDLCRGVAKAREMRHSYWKLWDKFRSRREP